MTKTIYFDMDGTIADLYGCENWLRCLETEKTKPYREAKPLMSMRTLGRILNTLKANGYKVGIVSWLSKSGTKEYNKKVTETKIKWLTRHLGAVEFDEIHIVNYGVPKETVVKNPLGILFDDEKKNRENWIGTAFDVKDILAVLRNL